MKCDEYADSSLKVVWVFTVNLRLHEKVERRNFRRVDRQMLIRHVQELCRERKLKALPPLAISGCGVQSLGDATERACALLMAALKAAKYAE
jgi:hypothetical protein